MKRVRLTIEVDSHFVTLLHANVMLTGGLRPGERLTASAVLARVVLAEARGGLPEQIEEIIPEEWSGNLRAICEERKVFED